MDRTDPLLATAPAAAPRAPTTDAVLGVPLALVDYQHTLDWIDAAVEHDHRGYICVAATHTTAAPEALIKPIS